ncbi:ABC transporter permease subunit [Georgenia halophila]|uniref:ABC transporter permease subunit n=1 Tax=Georgenia halophila TaxID=620889 RepID=A0ABP8L4W2_9MICO
MTAVTTDGPADRRNGRTDDRRPAGAGRSPTSEERARTARAEGWRRRAPLLPALIFTIVVTQVPFLVTIWYSLRSRNLLRPDSDLFVGFENYVRIAQDATFRQAAANSVIITLGCVLVAMVLGIVLAILLDRPFPGRSVARTMLITPFLLMPVANAVLWSVAILNPTYGLLNWLLEVFGLQSIDWTSAYPVISILMALVWQWTPFMMLLVLAGLQAQPRDVLEAAAMDGAGWWRTFASITLPQLRRYIELGVLLGIIYVVNTFDHIYIMTAGGPGTESANLPFYIYQRAFLGFDIGQAAAMGVVVVIATIIVAMLALRLIFRSFDVKE